MAYYQISIQVNTFSRKAQEGNSEGVWDEGFLLPSLPRRKSSFLLETDFVTAEDLIYITLTQLLTPRYEEVTKILYFSFDKLNLDPPTTLISKLFGHPPSAQAYLQFVTKYKRESYIIKEQLIFRIIEREKVEIHKMTKLLTHKNKAVRDFTKDYLERA